MAVVADFTADVTSGGPETIFNFTDISTGSPTQWLWNFGDGFFSSSQNPSHIYTEAGDYTVSLLAFDSTSSSQINGSKSNNLTKKGTGNDTSESAAWTGYLAETFRSRGNTVAESILGLGGTGKYIYLSTKQDISIDLTSLTPNANDSAILTVPFIGNPIHFHGGGMIVSGEISFTAKDPIATAGGSQNICVLDVSIQIGNNFTYSTDDINGFSTRWGLTLGIPPANKISGYRTGNPFVTHYVNNSKDTETKINYIFIGTPTANFSLIPSSGRSPLSVAFTNQSSNENTYSWRRRISGSGNAFIEFSTQENPTEIFDKGNP